MSNKSIDKRLIDRIIDTGADALYREGSSWRVGATKEIINSKDVRILCANGVLLGKKKNNILRINLLYIKNKQSKHLLMVGSTLMYRDTRYNWKQNYGVDMHSRYVHGTIIHRNHANQVLIIHNGATEIVTVQRPHNKATWKYNYAETVGAYAPGRPKYNPLIWNQIILTGMLPIGWDASPIGEANTFDRLRDVKRLLDMIGATPVTIEECVADHLIGRFQEKLACLRSQIFYMRKNAVANSHSLAMADAYDLLLEKEKEAIEKAEAKAVYLYVWDLHGFACYRPNDYLTGATERLKISRATKLPTLDQVYASLKKEHYLYSKEAIEIGYAEAVRINEEFKVSNYNVLCNL